MFQFQKLSDCLSPQPRHLPRSVIFDLEMLHSFEGGLVFAGHASQLSNPHDYLTDTIWRQPVVLMRDSGGHFGAFINSCRHKIARVCLHVRGNTKAHICQYHSWTYGSKGRNSAIKARASGGYTAGLTFCKYPDSISTESAPL